MSNSPNDTGGRFVIDPATGKRRKASEQENAKPSGEVVEAKKKPAPKKD